MNAIALVLVKCAQSKERLGHALPGPDIFFVGFFVPGPFCEKVQTPKIERTMKTACSGKRQRDPKTVVEGREPDGVTESSKKKLLTFTVHSGDGKRRFTTAATEQTWDCFDKVEKGTATHQEKATVRKILDDFKHASDDEIEGGSSDDSDGCLPEHVFTVPDNLNNNTAVDFENPDTFAQLPLPATVLAITEAAGYFEDDDCIKPDDDRSGTYNRPFIVTVQDNDSSTEVTIPGNQLTQNAVKYITDFMADHVYYDGRLYTRNFEGGPVQCHDVEVWKFQAMREFILSYKNPLRVSVTCFF